MATDFRRITFKGFHVIGRVDSVIDHGVGWKLIVGDGCYFNVLAPDGMPAILVDLGKTLVIRLDTGTLAVIDI